MLSKWGDLNANCAPYCIVWLVVIGAFIDVVSCENVADRESRYKTCGWNVTTAGCPNDPETLRCLSKDYLKCSSGKEYHCTRLKDNPVYYRDGCAASKLCLDGEAPYLVYFKNSEPTKDLHVVCDRCHSRDYFNSVKFRDSPSYYECDKKVRCYYEHGIECQSDTYKENRKCRCDNKADWILRDMRDVDSNFCSSVGNPVVMCEKADPCGEGYIRSQNYSCVRKVVTTALPISGPDEQMKNASKQTSSQTRTTKSLLSTYLLTDTRSKTNQQTKPPSLSSTEPLAQNNHTDYTGLIGRIVGGVGGLFLIIFIIIFIIAWKSNCSIGTATIICCNKTHNKHVKKSNDEEQSESLNSPMPRKTHLTLLRGLQELYENVHQTSLNEEVLKGMNDQHRNGTAQAEVYKPLIPNNGDTEQDEEQCFVDTANAQWRKKTFTPETDGQNTKPQSNDQRKEQLDNEYLEPEISEEIPEQEEKNEKCDVQAKKMQEQVKDQSTEHFENGSLKGDNESQKSKSNNPSNKQLGTEGLVPESPREIPNPESNDKSKEQLETESPESKPPTECQVKGKKKSILNDHEQLEIPKPILCEGSSKLTSPNDWEDISTDESKYEGLSPEQRDNLADNVLRNQHVHLINNLPPKDVLDHFIEGKFISDTKIKDIQSIQTDCDKNRRIMDCVRQKGFKVYLKFKVILHKVDRDLYRRIENEEDTVLKNIIGPQHPNLDISLVEAKDTLTNEDQYHDLSRHQLYSLVSKVLQNCHNRLVESLDPSEVLDHFIQDNFIPSTSIRDIQDMDSKSKQIRAIIEHVKNRRFEGYKVFMKILQSVNKDLLERLQAKEKKILDDIKSNPGKYAEVKVDESSEDDVTEKPADDSESEGEMIETQDETIEAEDKMMETAEDEMIDIKQGGNRQTESSNIEDETLGDDTAMDKQGDNRQTESSNIEDETQGNDTAMDKQSANRQTKSSNIEDDTLGDDTSMDCSSLLPDDKSLGSQQQPDRDGTRITTATMQLNEMNEELKLLEELNDKIKSQEKLRELLTGSFADFCTIAEMIKQDDDYKSLCDTLAKTFPLESQLEYYFEKVDLYCPDGFRRLNSRGDGNCLFNSVSILLFGTEMFSSFLRLCTAVTAASNWKEYSKQFQALATNPSIKLFLMEILEMESFEQNPDDCVQKLIMETARDRTYMSKLHVYFLSDAIGREIIMHFQSKKIAQLMAPPGKYEVNVPPVLSSTELTKEPLHILWVNMSGNEEDVSNHIVPLIRKL